MAAPNIVLSLEPGPLFRPRGPKTTSRQAKDRSRGAKISQRLPQQVPKRPQEPPRGSQEAAKTHPRGRQEGPGPYRYTQEAHKTTKPLQQIPIDSLIS